MDDVYKFKRAQKARTLGPMSDIPARLLAAVSAYESAYAAARGDRMKREDKKREADRRALEKQGHR